MNQLLRQQDTSCLRNRDRGRTEMLSKQPAELSLSDAQAFGESIDAAVIECAPVDQRQRPRYGVRRPAPGGELWRRFLIAVPDDLPLAKVLMHLARLPAEDLESLIATVIEQPEKATARLASLAI